MTNLKHVEVTVTVARRLEWRMRFGLALVRLGFWIATVRYRVATPDAPSPVEAEGE